MSNSYSARDSLPSNPEVNTTAFSPPRPIASTRSFNPGTNGPASVFARLTTLAASTYPRVIVVKSPVFRQRWYSG